MTTPANSTSWKLDCSRCIVVCGWFYPPEFFKCRWNSSTTLICTRSPNTVCLLRGVSAGLSVSAGNTSKFYVIEIEPWCNRIIDCAAEASQKLMHCRIEFLVLPQAFAKVLDLLGHIGRPSDWSVIVKMLVSADDDSEIQSIQVEGIASNVVIVSGSS